MDARDLTHKELENHFYYQGKRKLIKNLLKKANLPQNAKILDVGCGTGSDLKIIEQFGEITVLDINQESLNLINNNHQKICADLTNFSSKTKYDCIIAFDVLEHIDNHKVAAQNLFSCLKPNGKFIGSVPAYQFLYSKHDEVLAHYRRYTKTNFTHLLRSVGFKKLSSGYWMSTLLPIAATHRLINKNKPVNKTDIQIVPKPINWLFSQILKLEASIGTSKFFRFPAGLTTWIICEKTNLKNSLTISKLIKNKLENP